MIWMVTGIIFLVGVVAFSIGVTLLFPGQILLSGILGFFFGIVWTKFLLDTVGL